MEKETINQIKRLRNEKLSYKQISENLQIPETTIRYNCNEKYKREAIVRSQQYRKKEPLSVKASDYCCESTEDKDFTMEDIKNKFKPPTCYLTGTPIDFNRSETYCLDHIVPKAKGGKSNLENIGLLRKDVNAAKSDKTIKEFIDLCIEVLTHNGYEVVLR